MLRAFLQSARQAAAATMIMIVPLSQFPACVVLLADEGVTQIRWVGEAPSPCAGVATLDGKCLRQERGEGIYITRGAGFPPACGLGISHVGRARQFLYGAF